MKKLLTVTVALVLGFVAFGIMTAPAALHANKTTMGQPGPAGRPQSDTTSSARFEGYYDRAIEDCSNPKGVAGVLSYTSSPINITFTAGLGWVPGAASGYAGVYVLTVTNFGPTDAVLLIDQTSTAMTLTTVAGDRIPAGQSFTKNIQQTDGVTAHLFGLTQTTGTLNYTVCNY